MSVEKEPVGVMQVGNQLLGKFAVERVLGQGGMGVVVQASHMVLGHKVAIKLLLPEACEHPGSVERFLREARATVQIQSEHVARVSDVGSLPSGLPYMVMEYLEGRDLAEELRARGTLPVEEATRYVMQALEAIAEAHSLNIVHRDLKPANVFLARRKDGSTIVKVLDFGISKALEVNEVNLTQTSSMMGSPLYMAPEQIRNPKTVDTRADVWSLGIILHECLSGRPPFGATTLSGVLAAIVADPPQELVTLCPELPAALLMAVTRCLEKDPALRVQNVHELALLIAPFCPDQALRSLPRIAAMVDKTLPHGTEFSAALTLSQDAMGRGAAAATVPGYLPPAALSPSMTAQTWSVPDVRPRKPAWVRSALGGAGLVLILAIGAWWVTGDGFTPDDLRRAELPTKNAEPRPDARSLSQRAPSSIAASLPSAVSLPTTASLPTAVPPPTASALETSTSPPSRPSSDSASAAALIPSSRGTSVHAGVTSRASMGTPSDPSSGSSRADARGGTDATGARTTTPAPVGSASTADSTEPSAAPVPPPHFTDPLDGRR